MKVLFIVTEFDMGGITTACSNFANHLISRGDEVEILNMSGSKSKTPSLLDSKVKILYFDKKRQLWNTTSSTISSTKNIFKKLHYLFVGFKKKRLNKKGKWLQTIFKNFKLPSVYDVVIAYRQCAPTYYFALNCVNATNKIGFMHGDLNFMGDTSSWLSYLPKLDKVAYVSDAVKNGFIEKHPYLANNACTIYNMLDIGRINFLKNQQNPLNFSSDFINIATISRLDIEHKGVDRIPVICKNLKDLGFKNFRWFVVGGGKYKSYLEELSNKLGVNDILFFVGEQENPYAILKNAHFSVLTSKTESFGLVVLESLICSTPVISSYYPALTEIFEDGKYGFIAEQSIDSLVEKIKIFLEDKNKYLEIKNNCNSYNYSNDLSYNQFVSCLKR